MHRAIRVALPTLLAAGISCTKAAPAPSVPAPAPAPVAAAPAPAPTPVPAAATGAPVAAQPGGGGRGQPAAGGGGGRGGPQLTPEQRAARRDSLAAVRKEVLDRLKQQIAGRDSQPSGQVFKNVQLLKEAPAVGLLNTMEQYGRALSVSCTFCHVANQWDSDSLPRKKTARIMIGVVNAINSEQLTKMPAGRGGQTPRIGCTTCHRGNTQPGNALLP